jgi:HlyD family secretion protein
MNRLWKAALVLLGVGATAAGVTLLALNEKAIGAVRPDANAKAARIDDPPFFEVKPGKLGVAFEEWGILETIQKLDVFSQVEGTATIISLVPEGTPVVRGQLVCELDSSTIKDQLTNQEIATRSAEAAYQNAKLAREVAEIAVIEYEEGIYLQDRQTVRGEIVSAESSLKMVEERRDRIMRARERLNVVLAAKGEDRTAAEIVADVDLDDRGQDAHRAVARAQFAIEQARVKETVLEKYQKPRTTKELRSKVELATSDELAKQQTWSLQQSKEAKLRKQISNCKLFAPGDGPIVYANDANRFGPNQQPQIEEGSSVRERQKVFGIPDPRAPMRVNVKVPESVLDWITPGCRALIRVDGFADEPLRGQVTRVQPLPDVSTYLSRGGKVYTTHVAIEEGREGLTFGMTAQVEFQTTELANVLSVPVPAVVYYDRKDHVAVKKPDGKVDWREVRLGKSTGTMIEVKEGLKSGESVAIEATPLLNGGQKLKISLSPPRPARPPWGTNPAPTKANGAGGLSPAMRAKLQGITPTDRGKLVNGTPEERAAILKKAGFTADEIRAFPTLR